MKPTNNHSKPMVDKVSHGLANFESRYPDVVNPDKKEEETELQKLRRFAKLREDRAKAVNAFDEKTYSDVLDNLSQDEIDYYAKKRAETSPAQLFKEGKEEWFFRPSSYYMRDIEEYDGEGCYNGICSPVCEYYIAEIDEELRSKLKRQLENNNNVDSR